MNRRLLIPLVLLLLSACNTEDGQLPQPVGQDEARYQVMVVFAPGQLGDRGYADNVMTGVNLLSYLSSGEENDKDPLDICYISPWSLASMEQAIDRWNENAENPYKEGSYTRRLLVLTEPFMIPMLGVVCDDLRPTDEVLLLKVNDADVEAAAEEYGIGERLHGLNISAANSIRHYCSYMERLIRFAQQGPNQAINYDYMTYYRLYDDNYMHYRDSVYETLSEELGPSTEISLMSFSDEWGEGTYSIKYDLSVIDAAYLFAGLQQSTYESIGQAFAVIDLGTGNAGWDYWLMSRTPEDNTFHTLVIDGDEVSLQNRIYIKRFFGTALAGWCLEWTSTAVGKMPRMITHSGGDFCQDNIPDE